MRRTDEQQILYRCRFNARLRVMVRIESEGLRTTTTLEQLDSIEGVSEHQRAASEHIRKGRI